MTTRSGAAASADPAVDLSNDHSQPGPSNSNVAATGVTTLPNLSFYYLLNYNFINYDVL